jgi:cation diffusion facilitator CzcD-associated flavoprotein CzcO
MIFIARELTLPEAACCYEIDCSGGLRRHDLLIEPSGRQRIKVVVTAGRLAPNDGQRRRRPFHGDPQTVVRRNGMADGGPVRTRVVIIGAGFGGIGLGIKLKESGLNDFVILEKSDQVGGVWRQNCYPGAECDVPSHLYSFSFEPHADWPHAYAIQADILDYLIHCTRKRGIEPHIRYGAEVADARWDDTSRHWILRTSDGRSFEAQSLVTATGQLSCPLRPNLPGIASFAGTVFHSAEWRQDYDLRGKRVAVVGTGASAIQFIPNIAPLAEKLYVFQRSAAYVLPKPNKPYAEWQKFFFKHVPGALKLSRLLIYLQHEWRGIAFVTVPQALHMKQSAFRRYLRRTIKDPDLRRRLTPHYHMGCKRILLSNDYYPAMERPNVELVTERIKDIWPDAIVATDATERKVDCIIFGTGFAATDFLVPIKITGLGGRDLHQSWSNGAEAHLGITVAGFPNFFMLYGPNTNLGHNSIVYMIECQIHYIMACLVRLCRNEIRSLDIKKDRQERFNSQIQQRLRKTVWAKGCMTWYLTATGRNTQNWPGYTFQFKLLTRAPNWDDYAVQ